MNDSTMSGDGTQDNSPGGVFPICSELAGKNSRLALAELPLVVAN